MQKSVQNKMQQSNLFAGAPSLAELLRPQSIEEFVGFKTSTRLFTMDPIQSLILWGPPGSGKTSLAKFLAKDSRLPFEEASAVMCGTATFKSIFERAERSIDSKIVLLIDEIHHLNKSQQDIFLPHLEAGSIVLFGTTTENPSFELRPALLSRCKVVTFNRLELEDLEMLLTRAEAFINRKLPLSQDARLTLCQMADGDGRYLINRAEELFALKTNTDLSSGELIKLLAKRPVIYDKSGDEHYNLISALHKAMRGSDVDGALYWFSRMLDGGEDPLYIARRLVRFAVEDIGAADPYALQQAVAAQQAFSFLGAPEGELAIAQAVVYLATSPKSNAVYSAFNKARRYAHEHGSLMPPKRILNAPTQFMKDHGYSDGYVYDHDFKDAFAGTNFFPDGLDRQQFYTPVERGFEREIKKRIDWWDKRRSNAKSET
ncbi:MAG: replication-associated recombination protein A [Holosporales bacterium]|jgi:putative ATPase|nr:replication-associated recombination protein A [Holosporales bacterium]